MSKPVRKNLFATTTLTSCVLGLLVPACGCRSNDGAQGAPDHLPDVSQVKTIRASAIDPPTPEFVVPEKYFSVVIDALSPAKMHDYFAEWDNSPCANLVFTNSA